MLQEAEGGGVDEGVEVPPSVLEGFEVELFFEKRQSVVRTLWISADRTTLNWASADREKNLKTVSLTAIKSAEMGGNTPVFQKWDLEEDMMLRAVSIVYATEDGKPTSLNAVCPSVEMVENILLAITSINPAVQITETSVQAAATASTLGQLQQAVFDLCRYLKLGMDVSTVTLPVDFILPQSLLEVYAERFVSPAPLLIAANTEPDATRRALRVAAFIISTVNLFNPYTKPLNPVLGEVFECAAGEGDDSLSYLAEQVSHHPPVSAYVLTSSKHNFAVEGSSTATCIYQGSSIKVDMTGHKTVRLGAWDEEYEFTIPHLYLRLLRYFSEWCGDTTIKCAKTGVEINLSFLAKPIGRGSPNRVQGVLKPKKGKPWTLEGSWDGVLNATDGTLQVKLFDRTAFPPVPLVVPPRDKQPPYSSMNVWGETIDCIKSGKKSEAASAKTAVESQQRQLRKTETEPLQPRFFKLVGENHWKFVRD